MHVVYSKSKEVDNIYLLGLLNSSFMTWYYRAVHPLEVGKPMAEVKKQFVEELPIILGTKEQVDIIIDKTKALLDLCEKRQGYKNVFLKYIEKSYEPQNISERLTEFEKTTFKEFCLELKKQKVKLSASQQMDLLSVYEERTKAIEDVTEQINQIYRQLDKTVLSIYKIDNEIAKRIIESNCLF